MEIKKIIKKIDSFLLNLFLGDIIKLKKVFNDRKKTSKNKFDIDLATEVIVKLFKIVGKIALFAIPIYILKFTISAASEELSENTVANVTSPLATSIGFANVLVSLLPVIIIFVVLGTVVLNMIDRINGGKY